MHAPRLACGMTLLLLLGGCLNGDFGRVRPSLVNDDVHNWVGREAARDAGRTPSSLPLTDDERTLRDLAFPLIEPPYDRNRWDSVLLEWGLAPGQVNWPPDDHTTYAARLLGRDYRSPAARYSQLIDDIRNDEVRIGPFYAAAHRVLDMDARRDKSMAYVADLSRAEYVEAKRRIAENALVVDWVQRSLRQRADAYRYALERCVVATPSPLAVDAERALNALRQQITAKTLVVSAKEAVRAS
jgi:hypothetical protein